MGKYIKTFEAFGGKPLPVIPYDIAVNYYCCDNDHIYETINKMDKCAICSEDGLNTKVTKITKNEFNKKVKERLDDDEWEDFLKDQEERDNDLVNLTYFI